VGICLAVSAHDSAFIPSSNSVTAPTVALLMPARTEKWALTAPLFWKLQQRANFPIGS